MPPTITTQQARSRLPPKWMTLPPTPAIATTNQDTSRWSTHTLTSEHDAQTRNCRDPQNTQRQSCLSDLTCVDNDDDDVFAAGSTSKDTSFLHNDSDADDEELSMRIDDLMASTMKALEASNRLLLDTLDTRARLTQLHCAEAALDAHFTAREAGLRRQIQAVDDMSDFVSRKSLELQRYTTADSKTTTRDLSASAGVGTLQAMDLDATIGKTAAKRLEMMLELPTSPVTPRRSTTSRRIYSINTFSPVANSIAEEDRSATQTGAELRLVAASASPTKKRSVSHDINSDRVSRLIPALSGPSRALSSGLATNIVSSSAHAKTSTPTTTTSAETNLAALLGMPSRTDTPSDNSYFDSSLEDSVTSASPSTPGSIHAIHNVLSKPDDSIMTSHVRRPLGIAARTSFSISERDKGSDPYQVAQLRAEHSHGNVYSGTSNIGSSEDADAPGVTGSGGALKALQRLNELSSANFAGQQNEDDNAWYSASSKRSSLGLGLPSFSALKPSTARASSTATATPRSSTIASPPQVSIARTGHSRSAGWKGWTSWNASTPAPSLTQ